MNGSLPDMSLYSLLVTGKSSTLHMNSLKKFLFIVCLGLVAVAIICMMTLGTQDRNVVHESVTTNYTPAQLALGIELDRVMSCLKKFPPETLHELIHEENDPQGFKRQNELPKVLSIYNQLMASLSIKTVLIEPSMLFCMLIPVHKQLLYKHGFDGSNLKASKNVLTYGIHEDHAVILQREKSINTFRQSGFQPYFVQTAAADWMLVDGKRLNNEICSHAFYMYYEFTIHIVVFYNRSTFLWHANLESSYKLNSPPRKHLLFVDHPSAYEKFTLVQLPIREADFYIPSNPAHFLFQIPSSRFLECNRTINDNVSYTKGLPKAHSKLSVEEFNNRTLVAMKSLKKLLYPLFMNFWIFSGTMLGWYRDCGVIPYTSDVDFGAWASEVEDLDRILSVTLKNKELSLDLRMGVVDEALELRLEAKKLKVDIFFLYRINNGSWGSGHKPSRGYYFRYYYPPFTLCSAELLNEKVQVPCETEKVIVTEYGPEWMNPVSSWNYQSSIKNRGPNIYWDKEKRKLTYAEY